MILSLDKRWCDLYADASSEQTVREWIHDMYNYIYGRHTNIPDSVLDNMSQQELKDYVDALEWLANRY